MCRFLTPALFVLSTLLLAPGAQTDAQPVRGRINTETRLVTATRQREQILIDAVVKNDAPALAGVLAEDFTQYSLSHQMQPTPRADWLRNLGAHPFGKVRLENISAIDHGATLVVNFDLLTGDGKAAKRYGVVDVWTKPQSATEWMLSQRYIATPGSEKLAPGDNAPDTNAPPKRI